MIPATVKLQPALRGDTWQGIASIGPVTVNGTVISPPLLSARMQFRDHRDALAHELTTEIPTPEGSGTITIVDATNWQLAIDAQDLPLEAGTYHWDLETTDDAGTVRTLYTGQLRVLPDVTRG